MIPSPASSLPEQTRHDQTNLTTSTNREIVTSWELRRLVYNAILLPPGFLLLWRAFALGEPAGFTVAETILGLGFWALVFAVMANVCFSLAPYLEFVLSARGFRMTGMKIRPFVFAIGLFVSGFVLFLVWITLAGFGMGAALMFAP